MYICAVKIIISTSIAGDWRRPQNRNLWQGVNGVNNPCPIGWRIATEQEWKNEGLTSMNDAFTKLKLTYTGARDVTSGEIKSMATLGMYWTSTVHDDQLVHSYYTRIEATTVTQSINNRGNGYPCRCIKD
ncbi:MAG: hypothetical protein EOO85_33765 [Pedobacter sp.]|nr:MAG: hypothetical protein EOO85_33765 [Pedobacter sp.]